MIEHHCLRLPYLVLGWLVLGLIGTAASDAAVTRNTITFEGQTIRFIIGLRPGGGTDLQGRLVGHYMAKYLPGQPHLVYVNMPGADGVLAINYLAQQTKPDGTALIFASTSQLNPQLLKSDVVKYDARTLGYVGATSANGDVLLIRQDARARLFDKTKEPVVVADVDGTRTSTQLALWGHLHLGWNLRWVFGYTSANDMLLALTRGEADLTATTNINPIKSMLASGSVAAVLQRGRFVDGRFQPRNGLENVPVLSDLLEGKLTAQENETFNVWLQSTNIGKWLTLPSGTPPEIVAVYRAAFDKIGGDPDFIRAGKQQIDEEFELIPGKDLEVIGRQMADASPAAIKALEGLKDTIISLRKPGANPPRAEGASAR